MAPRDIDSVFQVVKRHWSSYPVDVVRIITECGIHYAEDALDPDISGMIDKKGPDGRYRIVINQRDGHARKRFTAAHELGHYVYHRGLIGDGIDDSRLYRSIPAGEYHNLRISPKHEQEANQFAANLLMPKHLLAQLEGKSIPEMAAALGVSVPAMRVRKGLPPYPPASEEFEAADQPEGDDEDALKPLDGAPMFKR
ncbi:MAG: ImmA/IrrE family metallo-endopeptidase [Rhizobiales bacterium]|nr:ImmA/IrrE family metallo-endopeptidase [Hyphomicrobiales bacterium]